MHPDRSLGLRSQATIGRNGTRQVDLLGQAAGNSAAPTFSLVVARYRRDVWDLALRMLRGYHAAEDIRQETFCRAYSAVERYDARGTSKAWLLTICRNLCLALVCNRRRRAHAQLNDGPEARCEPSPWEQRIDARRALAGLPHNELEAVVLVDVLRCRSREGASFCGAPVASAHSEQKGESLLARMNMRCQPLWASASGTRIALAALVVLIALASAPSSFAAGPAPVPCSAAGGDRYNCEFYPGGDGITAGAPVQASDGHHVGFLNQGTNWVTCESVGSTLTSGPYQNNWWAWTEANDGHWGWVNALYASGGDNFGPFAGVPACGASVGLPPGGQPPPPAASTPVPCTPIGNGQVSCTWYIPGDGSSGGSPVLGADGSTVGYLHKGTNWIVCEQTGAERSLGAFHNDWYGWTEADNGSWGWANALDASGGDNDAAFADVPACNGAHGAPPSGSPPSSAPPAPVQPPPVPSGGNLDATRRQIVAKALSEVGYNPDTDGCSRFSSIVCPGGIAYQEWCAVFATWAWQQGGVTIPILPYSGSPYTWAQQNTYVISPSVAPRAGDLVFFGRGAAGHQSDHVAVVAQVLPSGAIVTVNGNWGGGDGRVATATFFPSAAVRAGEPAPIYGYASPVKDQSGAARDAAGAVTLTAQQLIALIRTQDPRSSKRLQERLLRHHPAFAHMPYASARITIEIANYLRSGRVMLDVLYHGSRAAAGVELRHFLARYHDHGRGYRVHYRKAS